jgi:hypothetical protein
MHDIFRVGRVPGGARLSDPHPVIRVLLTGTVGVGPWASAPNPLPTASVSGGGHQQPQHQDPVALGGDLGQRTATVSLATVAESDL